MNSSPDAKEDDLYGLFYDSENESKEEPNIEDEINKAILNFNEYNNDAINDGHELHLPSYSSSTADSLSPFDSPGQTSVSSADEHYEKDVMVNVNTIQSIKQSMVDASKLNTLFTALKATYLKLCEEFNYLLHKFKENERVKFDLIHENNELRELLKETIKERELEKRRFRREIESLRGDLKRRKGAPEELSEAKN